MSVLTLDSVCKFFYEQLEMRNGCSGFAATSRLTLSLKPQDKKRLHRQLAM